MSDSKPEFSTPYADDAVHINDGTDIEEIHEFIRRRALNPREISGAIVWNFSTHEPNTSALEIAVEQFEDDRYAIPYQLNQTWAYMQHTLPRQIKRSTILRYNSSRGYYDIYRNFYQDDSFEEASNLRSQLAKQVNRDHGRWQDDR